MFEKPQIDIDSPSCKQQNRVEFDKRYYYQFCAFIVNKQKHEMDKKNFRQDKKYSTRLPYANEKMRERYFFVKNTKHKTLEGMIHKLQFLKGRTKLKFHKERK